MEEFYKIVVENIEIAENGTQLFQENGFQAIHLGRAIIFKSLITETNKFIKLMVALKGFTDAVTEHDIIEFNKIKRELNQN